MPKCNRFGDIGENRSGATAMMPVHTLRAPAPSASHVAGRSIFYPILNGTSKGDVVVLTKRMFDDEGMVLGKWMASMGRILL